MIAIVGLGNPGKTYERTVHNLGFMALDNFAEAHNLTFSKNKYSGKVAEGIVNGEKVILLKPETFMNLSGKSVIELMNMLKLKSSEVLVISDDIDLQFADLRLRQNGSAGTHNGMKSVIQNLNTEDFIRVRVGIGTPENKEDIINYVIGQIPKKERDILNKSIEKAKDSVIEVLENGIDIAMNKFN